MSALVWVVGKAHATSTNHYDTRLNGFNNFSDDLPFEKVV